MSGYEPRQFTCYDVARVAGIQFKPCVINLRGREPVDWDVIEPHVAEALVESPMASLQHRGLGYIIYHAGEDANWLLTRVWLAGDIVSGLMHRVNDTTSVSVKEPFVECVWEAVVTHHERNAWVQHMMRHHDPDAYLRDVLPNGDY